MTPDFASPEQVLGDPITTGSDVYSLGVLLYLLLTGTQPYHTAGLRPSERERLLCDTDPNLPSVTATQKGERGGSQSAYVAEPSRLRGDLDAIVLTALRKQPGERYASASALSDDIDAYLDGRPVAARGRTWGYVARKFTRRHAMPVLATALLLTSGVAAAIYHNDTVTAERDRAEAEVDRSTAVIAFMTDIFEVPGSEAAGAEITAKELLDAGAARLESSFESQPTTRAALGTTIANVYNNLGLYEEAIQQHRAALDINEAHSEEAAIAENRVGMARAHLELGNYEEAMDLYEDSLAMAGRLYPGDHVERARFLNEYGYAHYVQGAYSPAVEAYEEAIAITERLSATDHEVWGSATHNLGQVLHIQGNFDAAEPLVRASVDEAYLRYGRADPETAKRMISLATVLTDLQRFDEAEALLLEVLEIEKRAYGPDFPELDATMTNLGALYRKMDRMEDAERWLRDAIDHSLRTRGRMHAYTAYDMNNLARFLMAREDYVEAEPVYKEILSIYDETVGSNHPYVASASVGLAALYLETQRPAQARVYAQHAMDIGNAALEPGHWLTYNAMCLVGDAMVETGDLDAADTTLHDAYNGLVEKYPEHPLVRYAAGKLVKYYEARAMPDEASYYRAIHKGEQDPPETT